MIIKKFISILLTASITASVIPVIVYAEDNAEIPVDIQSIESETGNSVEYSFDEEATQQPYINEPIEYTEVVNGDIELPEPVGIDNKEETEISLFSTTDNDLLWKSLMTERFGDAYLAPWKKGDGQTVSGNTNRLVIDETDLLIPGKNGLDVAIRRRHDNQYYNNIYSNYLHPLQDGYQDLYNMLYIYAFTNSDTNETVYIGFSTNDYFYTYMENGITISELPSKTYSTTHNDNTIRFYYFENVYSKKSDYGITLTYDSSIEPFQKNIRYREESRYEIVSRPLLNNNNHICQDWTLVMPEASIHTYEREDDISTSSKKYWYYYVGAFRDIDGGVYQIEGTGKLVKPNEGENTYTCSFYSTDNKYLTFTPYFEMQTLPDENIQYNFVISDSRRGLKYYMNNTGISENGISINQRIYVMAVMDRFGNTIKYEYNSSMSVNKIIDTYGRSINITPVSGGKEVSYVDENGVTQTIQYLTETLDPSALDNDSPIKGKPVNRLKVINAAGETTIYDSREAEVVNFLHTGTTISMDDIPDVAVLPMEMSSNSNIERIIYPTGAETRYKYKQIYVLNKEAKTANGVYAVEESYDIISNTVKNHKTYTMSSRNNEITKTEEDKSRSAKTVYNYDSDGLLEKSITSATGGTSSKPYVVNTYSYASDNQLISVEVNNSGVRTTTGYAYNTKYPGSVTSESIGDKKVTYTYHTVDGKLTNMPQITNVQYKSGSSYVTDYSIETTLNSSGNAIEYVKTIQNDNIVAQKRYSYDAYGRISAIAEWDKDTNGDGVLDDNDNPVVTNSDYQTVNDGYYVVDSINNVLDADGTDTGSVSTMYFYNSLGNPYIMIDPNGNQTEVMYDGIGRIKKITYENGATETIDYDAATRMTNAKDKSGKYIWTYYDGFGNPTSKHFSDDHWTQYMSYSYDTCERLSSVNSFTDDNKYIKEQYTYDIFDRVLSKVVYNGTTRLYTENYTYNVSDGNTVITKTTAAADGTETAEEEETYNNLNQLIKKVISDESSQITYTYTYDYRGNILTETDANGNTKTYTYDFNNNVTKVKYPDSEYEFNLYDMMGRLIVTYDRDFDLTRYTYDKLNRVIDVKKNMVSSSVAQTKKYYDRNSNLIKESVKNNAQGDTSEATFNTTEYVYNNADNLIGVQTNDGSKNSAVQYWYDQADRVTAMATGLSSINKNSTAPTSGSITRYEYNRRGFLSKETDALGQSVTYTHDYIGNVKTSTDRNGAVTTNEYGPYGVTSTSITDGNKTEQYIYEYNRMGMLTSVKLYNNGSLKDTEMYTYDAFGRKLTETSNGKTNKYSYDLNSNITNYQLLDGVTVKNDVDYTYNNMNLLTAADYNGIIASYTYNGKGNITNKKIGDNETVISYNNLNLPVSYVTKVGDDVLNSYEYTYSVDGNRIGDIDNVNNINKTYEYDGAGRLVKETQSGAVNRVSSYTYDLRGNRTKETVTGDENYVTTNTYDANNRLTNQSKTVDGSAAENVKYYYDANGNQTFKQTYNYSKGGLMSLQGGSNQRGTVESFTYNLQNQLTGYQSNKTTASYAYGANGLRKSKTVGNVTTKFVWDRGNVSSEQVGNDTTVYNYGSDGIAARKTSSGDVTLYLKNSHGDVTGVTDESGSVSANYRYDAFGNMLSETSPDPFGYCGEYFDSESGLIYLRNRYYDSSTGRFITEDPAQAGLNWYVYCGNNPLMFIDPWGLAAGDDFYSVDEALQDMYLCYYGVTDYTQLEIGAAVYSFERDGDIIFSYTEPVVGEPENIKLDEMKNYIPDNSTMEGYVHTHASMNTEMDELAESFSGLDYAFTYGKEEPLYLMTRNGNIRMLEGRDSAISGSIDMKIRHEGTLIMSGLSYNKIEDESEKNKYALAYGDRWVKHLINNSRIEMNYANYGIMPESYIDEMHKPNLMTILQLEMLKDYLRLTGRNIIQ